MLDIIGDSFVRAFQTMKEFQLPNGFSLLGFLLALLFINVALDVLWFTFAKTDAMKPERAHKSKRNKKG